MTRPRDSSQNSSTHRMKTWLIGHWGAICEEQMYGPALQLSLFQNIMLNMMLHELHFLRRFGSDMLGQAAVALSQRSYSGNVVCANNCYKMAVNC